MYATAAPSVFESFNARTLEPAQVAKTFVPPPEFYRVVQRSHTLIIGPRGSGKTTVLKMLQPEALEAWRGSEADDFRSRVDFTGVFIPTDLAWREQLSYLGGFRLQTENARLLSRAAFTTHVLRALVSALIYRSSDEAPVDRVPYRRIELSQSAEADLVAKVAEAWHLEPQIPNLRNLRYALSARMVRLREIGAVDSGSADIRALVQQHPFLSSDFIEAAAVFVDAVDAVSREPSGKWALLFDELELAPDAIRRQLLESLRSVESRFIFKLSLSPYTSDMATISGPGRPMQGQDYDSISLSYPNKEAGRSFSRALFAKILEERGIDDVTPERLLGDSILDSALSASANQAAVRLYDRHIAQLFTRVADRDSTFDEYLASRNVDLTRLRDMTEAQRAAELRKIAPLVALRETFLDLTDSSRRSRKNPDVYSGANALFDMVEGNPRWLIGIALPLLEELRPNSRRIPPFRQSREVARASSRFLALLRTLAPASAASPTRGILDVLDPIGNYFSQAVLSQPFNPDPPGSFGVDVSTELAVVERLGLALNAGAIVLVPRERGQVVVGTIRGERFRLSYLLAPQYRLPLRLGRAVSLSMILRRTMPPPPEHPGGLWDS